MTTLADQIQMLYEAKLYEDVKTLVSIAVVEDLLTVVFRRTVMDDLCCEGYVYFYHFL